MHELILHGCTPEPLMSYLKALGILRLVAEQADPEARAAWRTGVFVLSSDLDEDALMKFFLEKYRPTPLLAPWNGGCGFYLKWDPKKKLFKSRDVVDAMDALYNSTAERLAPYRADIRAAKTALARLAKPVDVDTAIQGKSPKEQKKILDSMLLFQLDGRTVSLGKVDKDDFLATMRSEVLSDAGLNWLDAALVLLTGRKKNRMEAPTLGSGGNVGNSDFSGLFVQLLPAIIPFNEGDAPPPNSQDLLHAAVFATPVNELSTSSIGQFDPGKAGGANAGQGMEANPLLNPWDYVLMLEGTLLLGGAISRRQAATTDRAVFPFIVESSGVGYGSAGKDKTRGELWLPLWRRACSTLEIKLLFGEGRAEVGRQRAASGVTFARAAASLGVDRGIDAFIRYEFQERLGQNYLASSLGYFVVRTQRNIDLFQEVDDWLERFRGACREDTTPPRFSAALRRIDSAIFDFCRYGGNPGMAEVLCALGNAEHELANGEKFRKTNKRTIQPVPSLSAAWISACDDGSAEFRLALALASIRGDRNGKVGDVRVNLEPVERKGSQWRWAEKNRAVVWSGADLCRNLAAVLTRRVMDAGRTGLDALPLDSCSPASLNDVATFLAGETDDHRLEELLWGLLLIDGRKDWREHLEQLTKPLERPLLLPGAYALLKLLFPPRKLSWPAGTEGVTVKPKPEILGRLRAGDVNGACEIATRRLRASGFVPMPGPPSGGTRREIKFSPCVDAVRLAAALLLPVSETTRLARLALRPQAEEPAEVAV